MAKRATSSRTAGNGRSRRKANQDQDQPMSATAQRVAETGGSTRVATMEEERSRRANAVSGRGDTPRQQPKLSEKQREAAKKGTPRPEQKDPQIAIQSQLDHGAVNHTREKTQDGAIRTEGVQPRTEARGSTPWPANIVDMEDREAAEAIRTTDKADVLYKWREDLRQAADPSKDFLVDLIFEKLLRVQGPPLPQSVL